MAVVGGAVRLEAVGLGERAAEDIHPDEREHEDEEEDERKFDICGIERMNVMMIGEPFHERIAAGCAGCGYPQDAHS